MKTCELTIERIGFGGDSYSKCGRPAKYITPTPPMGGKKNYVCGIHKNEIDSMHRRIGSCQRCKELPK